MNQHQNQATAGHRNAQRIAFVQACWHKDIVDRCRVSFTAEIAKHGFGSRSTGRISTGCARQDRAQLFSAESGTACAAAWKPIFEWVPSQNGFFVDAPQRQSTVLS